MRFRLTSIALISLLTATGGSAISYAAPTEARTPAKTRLSLPPSATLKYTIEARQSGLKISGDTEMKWQADTKLYSVSIATRAMVVGKILDERSTGSIDGYGLAPATFTEKRFRKKATTATFNREDKTIRFSAAGETFPITGGEQDRASAIWQLASMARATPAKFKSGSSWTMPVAGRREVKPWTFKVIKKEKVKTPLGTIDTLQLQKMPSQDSREQQITVWLAPSHHWYPVKLRFSEANGDYINQTLQKIEKR